MAVNTGAMFKSLTFDGIDSRDYGVYITGEAVYNAPTRRVNMIQIPGRNGLFAQDEGAFDNITVTYPAGLFGIGEADFASTISDFRNALCSRVGYKRLEDGYNSDEYRMAVYKSGLEVSPSQLKAGEFEISFECKPQRWLKSGETWQTVVLNQYLDNPTLFDASPTLEIRGYGTIELIQGDNVRKNIVVTQASGVPVYLYIDCETGFAYYQNPGAKANAGDRVTIPIDLPRLTVSGHNRFSSIDGTITSLRIQPRWWRV